MQGVLERFSENKAVLYLGDEEEKVVFPRHLLPREIEEGDYFQLEIKKDEEATEKALQEAESLLRELSGE